MANFESGVASYVTGTVLLKVHFPVDLRGNADISCYQCRYYSRSSGVCKLNSEVVAYPQKYVGQYCPLEFTREET